MNSFKFFQNNPNKNRCQLMVGSSFIFRGHYCTVSRMLVNHFEYIVQETQKTNSMHYNYYLTTPSASGRQLNRR